MTEPMAALPQADDLVPNVGQILQRLRTQRQWSIREVAELSELSPSFLRAVERGESDISLGRVARLARVFDYDLGSFLGFTAQLSRPNFVGKQERVLINRGAGVRYESLRLPGVALELELVELGPHSKFRDDLSHEGIDIVYVVRGDIVLVVNNVDYPMHSGECCVFAAGFPHKIRNDGKESAFAISLTTGHMY